MHGACIVEVQVNTEYGILNTERRMRSVEILRLAPQLTPERNPNYNSGYRISLPLKQS
jgi:hypothetical protein